MATLNKDELKMLSRQRNKTCISIYIPTYHKGREIEQDPIRFKNMLRDVSAKMEKQGFRSNEIEEFLLPATKLLDAHGFWNHQSDGLAVFLSENEFYIYRLPLAFTETDTISQRFNIKQLLPLFADDGRFLILALDLNNLRLFEASRYHLAELELAGISTEIDDFLKYENPERQLQYHTGMRNISGRHGSIYHGHGKSDDSERKRNILRFFEAAEKGIGRLIASREEPMILIGLESNLAIYKEANSYPHLLAEAITANPEDMDADELHKAAWEAVEPYFESERLRGLEKYNTELGTGLASNDLKDIIKASHDKRVEYLFLKKGEQVPGTYNPEENLLHFCEKDEECSEDLLDFTAVQTILSDGAVYIIDGEQIPGDIQAAAVYRY